MNPHQRIRHLAGIGATLVLLGAGSAASAQSTVPAASVALHYPGGDQSFVGANASASFACGTLDVSGGPSPTLTSSSADCGDVAQAILIYYFSIVGPASGTPIPVTIASSAELQATGSYQAGYSLRVGFEDLHGGNCLLGASEAACGTHGFLDARSFDANTNYGVVMMAVTSGFLGAGTGYARLDPVFAIDPRYADAYSLRFSEGVMNGATSPVPEPESMLLMAGGLFVLAARRRRLPSSARRARRVLDNPG